MQKEVERGQQKPGRALDIMNLGVVQAIDSKGYLQDFTRNTPHQATCNFKGPFFRLSCGPVDLKCALRTAA